MSAVAVTCHNTAVRPHNHNIALPLPVSCVCASVIFPVRKFWSLSGKNSHNNMAGREVVRKTLQQVRPILSLDNTEARRRVLSLYKAWYRQIPYIGEFLCVFVGPGTLCGRLCYIIHNSAANSGSMIIEHIANILICGTAPSPFPVCVCV